MRIIQDAKSSISISTWILTTNAVSSALFALLQQKAKEGVEVTVVHYGGQIPQLLGLINSIVTISGGSPLPISEMKGIHDIPYIRDELFGVHQKITCVDRQRILFSDRNLGSEYYQSVEGDASLLRYIGVDVLVENATLGSSIHSYITSGLQKIDTLPLPSLRFITSEPSQDLDPISQAYVAAIDNAKEWITIVNVLFSPTQPILDALRRAVSGRGIKLKIITNFYDHISDAREASASRNMALSKVSGLTATLLGFKDTVLTLHHKYMITDQEVVFGSFNFDFYSEELDVEYIIQTQGLEPFRSSLIQYTTELEAAHCVPISVEVNDSKWWEWFYSYLFRWFPWLE